MNIEELFNKPNYDGLNKKEKQRLLQKEFEKEQIANYVKENLLTEKENSIDLKTYNKYIKQGVLWNPKDYASGSLDRQLADAQSNWSKAGNALLQTFVSEIGLGTIKAVPDMIDGFISLFTDDNDYSNPISAKIAEWQDAFNNEVAPIYAKPGESWGDFGWWMQHLPSVASSVTLLIPASLATKGTALLMKGVSKGISAITKSGKKFINLAEDVDNASKASRLSNLKLGPESKKIANFVGETASMAFWQRLGENYQESGQVMEDMFYLANERLNEMSDEEYNKWLERNKNLIFEGEDVSKIDLNDKSEVARLIAKHSADATFRFDWINSIFDVVQMLSLSHLPMAKFKGIKNHTMGSRKLAKLEKKFGDNATVLELKARAKTYYKDHRWEQFKDRLDDLGYGFRTSFLGQASEGVEEAINYIAQQEGMTVGRVMLDMEAKSTFSNRLNQYVRNGELWENAFWGVLGGITFSGIANKSRDIRNNISERKQQRKKENSVDEVTGEDVNAGRKSTYKDYWYSSEYKRVAAAIDKKAAIHSDFVNKYKEIMNDETISDADKKLYLDNLLNEKKQEFVLNAIQTGTVDMLKVYLQNDKVKNYFKENTELSKLNELYNIDDIFAENLAYIDYYKKEYREVVKNLNRLAKTIIGSSDNEIKDIPAEYLEMIAQDEVFKKSNIKHYDNIINSLEEELNSQFDIYDQLGIEAELFKDVMFYSNAIDNIKKLKQQKNEILNNKNISKTILAQENINDIDRKISAIRENILSSQGLSSLLLVDLFSTINGFDRETFTFTKTPKNGKYDTKDNNIIDLLNTLAPKDGSLTENFDSVDKKLITDLDVNFEYLTENDFYLFKSLNDRLSNAMKIIGSKKSNDDIKTFMSDVDLLNAIKLERSMANSSLINNTDKLKNELYNLHNYTNELRKHALDLAIQDILKLANEVGVDELKNEINLYFETNTFSESNLTEEQQTTLKGALDVFNLHSQFNKHLYTQIENILDIYKASKIASESNDNPPTEEDIKRKEKEQAEKDKEQAKKEQIKKENKEKAEKDKDNILKKLRISDSSLNPKEITTVNIEINQKPIKITIDPSAVYDVDPDTITNNPDIQFYELILEGDQSAITTIKAELNKYYTTLYATNDNSIITKHIIIDENGNIYSKGLIEDLDLVSETIIETNKQAREDRQNNYFNEILSKGERESTNEKPIEEPVVTADQNKSKSPIDSAGIFDEYKPEDTTRGVSSGFEPTKEEYEREQKNISKKSLINKEIISYIKDNSSNLSEDSIDGIKRYLKSKLDITEEEITEEEAVIRSYVKAYIAMNKIKKSSIQELDDEYIVDINNTKFLNIVRLINDFKNANIPLDDIIEVVKDIYNNKYLTTVPDETTIYDYINDKKSNVSDNNVYSINIANQLNKLVSEAKYKFDLKVGDKITYRLNDNGVEFLDNNVVIGFLPYPILTKGNHQYQINDGWITDIDGSDNNFKSNFKDFILNKILNQKDDESKKLLSIILQYNTASDKSAIINDFMNHEYIINAKNTFISDKADPEELIQGLNKILTYKLSEIQDDQTDDQYDMWEYFVDKWFEKVKESFDFINSLKNSTLELVVEDINNGEAILITNNTENFKELPLIKDALGNHDFAIGVIPDNKAVDNNVKLSNGQELTWDGGKMGTTILVIEPNSNRPVYINCWGVSSNSNNDFLNDMFNVIISITKNNPDNVETILNYFSPNKGFKGLMKPLFNINRNVDDFIKAFKDGEFEYNIAFSDISVGSIKRSMRHTSGIINYLKSYVNKDSNEDKLLEKIKEKYIEPYIINAEAKDKEYDYFKFIYENNLVHVNTKAVNGSNFKRDSEDPKKQYNISVKVNRKEKLEKSNKEELNQEEELNKIINDTSIENKGLAIAKLLNVYDFNNEFLISLLPKNIALDKKTTDSNAYVDVSDPTKTVYLTANWLKLFNGDPNNKEKDIKAKKEAVRKLIHEKLHITLHEGDNKKYYNQIEEIYNEFEKALPNLNKTDAEIKFLEQYLFKDKTNKEDRLEEFLIETLTSNKLAEILNEIKVDEDVKVNKENESLFQRIMRILSELFGITIKDNTLYAKEYNLLKDITSNEKSNKQNNKTTGVTKPKARRRKSTIMENTYPSINDFISKFSINDQDNIRKAINNGYISVKCKI